MTNDTPAAHERILPNLVTLLYAQIVIACSRRTLHRLIAKGLLTVYRPTTSPGHSLVGQVTLLDMEQVHKVAKAFAKGEIDSGPVRTTGRRRSADE